MELEELQKAWKELNERVSQNELVHQQQIIEMLSRQKESCLQRMLRMDKIASIFMLGVTILMFVDFIHLNGKYMHIPLHLPPPVVAHDNNVWFNLSRCTDRLLPLPSCIGQN